MTTINDFVGSEKVIKPSKNELNPRYDKNGIRIETEEEIENWKKI